MNEKAKLLMEKIEENHKHIKFARKQLKTSWQEEYIKAILEENFKIAENMHALSEEINHE